VVIVLTISPPLACREPREVIVKRDAEQENAAVTILLVDDEPQILRLVSNILEDYNILTASTGSEAILRSNQYKNEIDLLLSDFEMPGMTGMELAAQITVARPKIKVLLMSGYTGGMLVLNEGWHFLAKPFIPSQLRSLVQAVTSQQQEVIRNITVEESYEKR